MRHAAVRICFGLGLFWLVLGGSGSRADRIVIRGGGEIRGVVLPELAEKPDILRVLTRTSTRPMELRKAQVSEVIPDPDDPLRAYLERREQAPASAEAQVALAEWCESVGLTGPAQIQYQAALEIDPNSEPARRKLGYVFHGGRWMTYTEQRQAQGLVLHKGRWVSPQEKASAEEKDVFTADQLEWQRRLKQLRLAWLQGNAQQHDEAEAELSAVRDPAAASAFLQVFGGDPDLVRIRLAQWLANIDGPQGREALVRMLLREPAIEVRQATLQELKTRNEPETISRLIKALESKDPIVVGRAAWALGMLDAVSAVPKLVPVLVQSQSNWVMEPTPAQAGAMNATFGYLGDARIIPPNAGVGSVGGGARGNVSVPPAYANGSSIPILTGPVVGDGVVAFGGTSVPFYGFGGFGVGGANPNRPTMRLVTSTFQNEAVLQALERLTGVSFGYDQIAWRRWIVREFRNDPAPGRRAPQP